MLGVCSGVTSPGDTCEEMALGLGMVNSVPSGLSRSSAWVECIAPKAADGGFLPGMLC